jgi:hypothetical protein
VLRRAPDDSDGVGLGELRVHRISGGSGDCAFLKWRERGPAGQRGRCAVVQLAVEQGRWGERACERLPYGQPRDSAYTSYKQTRAAPGRRRARWATATGSPCAGGCWAGGGRGARAICGQIKKDVRTGAQMPPWATGDCVSVVAPLPDWAFGVAVREALIIAISGRNEVGSS